MNLGLIWLGAVIVVMVGPAVITVLVVSLLGQWRHWRRSLVFGVTALAIPIATTAGLYLLQAPVFRVWHCAQNDAVPHEAECLLYEPTFSRLKATYAMPEADFRTWLAEHPWPLQEGNEEVAYFNREWLGEDFDGEWYATEMTDNGAHLNVYYKDDKVWIDYYAN